MQEIVGALYTDNAFYRALNNALHHDGAVVAQIGEANSILDPPSMFSDDRNCDGFVDGLEALNFTEMTEYQEVSLMINYFDVAEMCAIHAISNKRCC